MLDALDQKRSPQTREPTPECRRWLILLPELSCVEFGSDVQQETSAVLFSSHIQSILWCLGEAVIIKGRRITAQFPEVEQVSGDGGSCAAREDRLSRFHLEFILSGQEH